MLFRSISWAKNTWARQFYSDAEVPIPNTAGVGEATSIYESAIRMKTENCTEHASVAFIYLYRLNIRPIVMLGYNAGITSGLANHMVVAVGLDLDAYNFANHTRDEAFWQKEIPKDKSWICDPWKNITYRAATGFYENEPASEGILQIRAWAI